MGPGIFRELGADGTQWGVLPCRAVALLGGITPEQRCPRRSRSLLVLSETREHYRQDPHCLVAEAA